MTVVADLVARVRGDTADLESSLTALSNKLDGLGDQTDLGEPFKKGAEHARNFSSEVGAGANILGDMEQRALSVGRSIKDMVVGLTGAVGFGAVLNMAKSTTMELQTLGVQFNSTFGSGSGPAALQSAIKDANAFGTSIQSTASGYQNFAVATIGHSENMKKVMKDAADAAAGTGMSIDQVTGAWGNYFDLVQRLGGSGGNASRFATTLLTEHLITPQMYNQLRLAANVGADPQQLLDMIMGGSEMLYGGSSDAYAKTFGGRLQTFKNEFSTSSASALSPITGGVSNLLADANKMMDGAGFKKGVTDVAEFIGAIGKGAAVLAPFVKDIATMTGGIAGLAVHLGIVKEVIGPVVAGLLLLKGVEIVGNKATEIYKWATGLGEVRVTQTQVMQSTQSLTAAINAMTEALNAQNGVLAERDGLLAAGAGGAGGVSTPGEMAAGGGGFLATARSKASGLRSGLLTMGGIVGGQVIGNAIGGETGNLVGGAIQGATFGGMVGSAIPGVGTAVGAAAGAVIGMFVAHVQSAGQAAQAFANTVSNSVQKTEGAFFHPNATNAADIQANYDKAKADYSGYLKLGPNPTEAQREHAAIAKQVIADMNGSEYNKNLTLGIIQSATGLSRPDAAKFAADNSIDLSQSFSKIASAVQTATNNLNGLGGAAQFAAEQVSQKLGTIGGIVSGQYGNSSFNLSSLLKGNNISWDAFTKLAQGNPDAGVGPIDLGAYGISQNSANQNYITPQYATQLNTNIQVNQQFRDAQYATVTAANAVTQALWGQQQAAFALSQAQFQGTQANFQLGRATLEYNVALTTQGNTTAAVATVIKSGYLPANYNVSSSLQQITSLTDQQKQSLMDEVSAYNALQDRMYGADAAGNSLWSTYTQLSGAVQEVQAQMQTYQDTLSLTLAGTKEYNALKEQELVASASTSMEMAQLQLEGYSTSSPEYLNAQWKARQQQAQATITQSQYTMGLGQQQFQISQAQLAPDASFDAMLKAAQGIGALQGPLQAAKQALDAVAPTYDTVNTALTIQGQKNQAVTTVLQAQASADQGVIAAANNVVVANQAVVTAFVGIVNAQRGVTEAGWQHEGALMAQKDATDQATVASNNFAAQAGANIQKVFDEIQGLVTNIGVGGTQALSAIAMTEKAVNQVIQLQAAISANQIVLDNPASGKAARAMAAANITMDQWSLAAIIASGQAFGVLQAFDSGGPVPGSGPQLAVVHGGEHVVPAGGSLVMSSTNAKPSITISSGAVQVNITVSGATSTTDAMKKEATAAVEETLQRLINKWTAR